MTSLVPLPETGLIREWVDHFGSAGETPTEAHLAAALALVSAAIGWRAEFSWNPPAAESCNLYVLLAGQSATARKTTTLEIVGALVRQAYTGDPRGPRDRPLRVQTFGHISNRGLWESIAPKDREQADQWYQAPPPGLLAVFDEFGTYVGGSAANRDNNNGTGGGSYVDNVRKALMDMSRGKMPASRTGQIDIPESRVAVSILAAMTSDELKEKITPELIKSGFLGRFLLIPLSPVEVYRAFPNDEDVRKNQEIGGIARWIRFLSDVRPLGNVMEKHNWDKDAYDQYDQWYKEKRLEYDERAKDDPSDQNTALAAAMGRLPTAGCKIATCLALTRKWNPDPLAVKLRITMDDILYGEEMVLRTIANIAEMLEYGMLHKRDRYARKVLSWLRKRPFDFEDAGQFSEIRRGEYLGRWAKQKEIHDHVKDSLDAHTRWNIIESYMGVYWDIGIYSHRGQKSRMVRLLPESDPASPVETLAIEGYQK